jgi:ribosomal protein S18 acetylase RimI-like enzyme
MTSDISVTTADSVDAELLEALGRLIPQLSQTAMPTATDVQSIVDSSCTVMLVARDRAESNRIVGTLTLAVFRIPTGVRAWIEDVVVDQTSRGKGVGEALSREAIRIAFAKGARTVELTSRPSREAANRLYQRIGFRTRATNVYRYSAGSDE